jgi:hypothetical protein
VRNSVAAWGIKVLRSCERGARKTEIADIRPRHSPKSVSC